MTTPVNTKAALADVEQWPNLTHQKREELLAACQRAGVDCTDKWLSEAALEAIRALVAEVERLRKALGSVLNMADDELRRLGAVPGSSIAQIEADARAALEATS